MPFSDDGQSWLNPFNYENNMLLELLGNVLRDKTRRGVVWEGKMIAHALTSLYLTSLKPCITEHLTDRHNVLTMKG